VFAVTAKPGGRDCPCKLCRARREDQVKELVKKHGISKEKARAILNRTAKGKTDES